MCHRYAEDVHIALVEEMVVDVDGINCSLSLLLITKNLGENKSSYKSVGQFNESFKDDVMYFRKLIVTKSIQE